MINKDFSYYIEQTEPLVLKKFADVASILQLGPKVKFTALTNHHLLHLVIVFHPDKVQEKDRLKAHAIFHQLIYPAIRRSLQIDEPAESFDAIIDRLFPVPLVPEAITMKSSFIDIFTELTSKKAEQAVLSRSNKNLTYNYQAELEKKRRLFGLLKAKADTPNQLLEIIQFQIRNNDDKGPTELGNPFSSMMLQSAVRVGSPLAIFLMARSICLGHYGTEGATLVWAVDALRYLEAFKANLKIDFLFKGMEVLRADWNTNQILSLDKMIPKKDAKEEYESFFDKLRKAVSAIQGIKVVGFPALPHVQALIPLTKMSQDRPLAGNLLATDSCAIQPPSPAEAAASIAAATIGCDRGLARLKDDPKGEKVADLLEGQESAEKITVSPDLSKQPAAFGFSSLSGFWGLFSSRSIVSAPAKPVASVVISDSDDEEDYHVIRVIPGVQVSASAASG